MTNSRKIEFTGYDLKEARKRLGLSQKELAEELNIARTTVVTAEKATPKPWMQAACIGLGGMRVFQDSPSTLSGQRFIQLRERLGLTQSKLGAAWGVTERTIRSWELGAPPEWVFPAIIGLTMLEAMAAR